MPVDPITIPFRQLDTDGSGKLSSDEIKSFVETELADINMQMIEAEKLREEKAQEITKARREKLEELSQEKTALLDKVDAALKEANQNNDDEIDNGKPSWYDPISSNGFDEIASLKEKLQAAQLLEYLRNYRPTFDWHWIFSEEADLYYGSRAGYNLGQLKDYLINRIGKAANEIKESLFKSRQDEYDANKTSRQSFFDYYSQNLVDKTVGNYSIPSGTFENIATPALDVTATPEEEFFYNKRFAPYAVDDKIVKGKSLANFLSSYTSGLSVRVSTNLDVRSNATGGSGKSDGLLSSSSSKGGSTSTSTSFDQDLSVESVNPLDAAAQDTLYEETSMRFLDPQGKKYTSFDPINVISPGFKITWGAPGKKAAKTEWTYREMFAHYFKNHPIKESRDTVAK